MLRRVRNEINKINKIINNEVLSSNISINTLKDLTVISDDEVEIMVFYNKKLYCLTFKFPREYPFRRPDFLLYDNNNKQINYLEFNRINYNFYRKIIPNIFDGKNCPCCTSILCNWTVKNDIISLINEFISRLKDFEINKEKFLLDKVSKKCFNHSSFKLHDYL
jgi:hypothetical protein